MSALLTSLLKLWGSAKWLQNEDNCCWCVIIWGLTNTQTYPRLLFVCWLVAKVLKKNSLGWEIIFKKIMRMEGAVLLLVFLLSVEEFLKTMNDVWRYRIRVNPNPNPSPHEDTFNSCQHNSLLQHKCHLLKERNKTYSLETLTALGSTFWGAWITLTLTHLKPELIYFRDVELKKWRMWPGEWQFQGSKRSESPPVGFKFIL